MIANNKIINFTTVNHCSYVAANMCMLYMKNHSLVSVTQCLVNLKEFSYFLSPNMSSRLCPRIIPYLVITNDFQSAGQISYSVLTLSLSFSLRFMWQKEVEVTLERMPRRALMMFLVTRLPFPISSFLRKRARFMPPFSSCRPLPIYFFSMPFKSLLSFNSPCRLLFLCLCSWMDGNLMTFFLLPNYSRLRVAIFWLLLWGCCQLPAIISQSSVLFLFLRQGRWTSWSFSSLPKQGVPPDTSELFYSSISSSWGLEWPILKYSLRVRPTQSNFCQSYFPCGCAERGVRAWSVRA